MAKRYPDAPAHPERICWGCDSVCPASDMRCGNGSVRTEHPVELFGPDGRQTVLDEDEAATLGTVAQPEPPCR